MGLVAAALATVIAPPPATPSALAGTYAVVACDAAPGGLNHAWHEREDRGMLAGASCPSRGDRDRGLTVRNRVNAGRVGRGKGASMAFRAPAGAGLRSIALDWDGRRATGDWQVGLVRSDGRLLAGCRPARRGRSPACRLGGPKGAATVTRRLGHRRSVRIEARCATRDGCSTGALRHGRDRTRVRLAAHRAEVVVADDSAPNVTVGGPLLRPEWLRGTVEARVSARDNVGVRSTAVWAGDVRRGSDRQRCFFTRPVPCPRSVRAGHRLDTRTLPDGRHLLELSATDAARNRRAVDRMIRVDNHAPSRVSDVRLRGGDGLRAVNSFDVRWTPPPGQAAPIVAAHYRLCRRAGPRECVTGSRAGAVRGIDDLRVPGRGNWAFQVWLEDEAGNVEPANASARLTLRFDDRAVARLTAGVARGGDRPRRRAKVGFGERAVVAGSLSGAFGARIGRSPLAVLTRVRGEKQFRHVGRTWADASGDFRHRLPAGPSRTIRVEFAGSDRYRSASDRARLEVRARSSMTVSRHRVENGDSVRFRGRLLGGHVPAQGKLVQLEAFYRDRWRTFAVVRSSPRGGWRYRYRFEATRGRVRYPFRTRIPRERDYPYALGRSRVVRVTVRGR